LSAVVCRWLTALSEALSKSDILYGRNSTHTTSNEESCLADPIDPES
jgi:hypothetical protein